MSPVSAQQTLEFLKNEQHPSARFWRLATFDEVDSTNNHVKDALRAGEPEGCVASALLQTGGYGRQGRVWVSPYGGLYTSFGLQPTRTLPEFSTLSLMSALAVRASIERFCLAHENALDRLRIKWPNDLLFDGRKICGISLEAIRGASVCIGIGVNIFRPKNYTQPAGKYVPAYLAEEFPAFMPSGNDMADEVSRSQGVVLEDSLGLNASMGEAPGTVSHSDSPACASSSLDCSARAELALSLVPGISPEKAGTSSGENRVEQDHSQCVVDSGLSAGQMQVMSAYLPYLLEAVFEYYECWQAGGFGALKQEFTSCMAFVGSNATLENIDGSEITHGIITGVGDEGQLLLRKPDGTIFEASSGEVHVANVC